ncbi:unnamed protein product [Tenebrio molitor]|nr:unnamed protein product [Tenebrio molitor]
MWFLFLLLLASLCRCSRNYLTTKLALNFQLAVNSFLMMLTSLTSYVGNSN